MTENFLDRGGGRQYLLAVIFLILQCSANETVSLFEKLIKSLIISRSFNILLCVIFQHINLVDVYSLIDVLHICLLW